MNERQLKHLAELLKAARPDPRDTPQVWSNWTGTVKAVAAAAPTVELEAKFLRDAGHSA